MVRILLLAVVRDWARSTTEMCDEVKEDVLRAIYLTSTNPSTS